MNRLLVCLCLLLLGVSTAHTAAPVRLAPALSPVDNPLKGLVPYAHLQPGKVSSSFPHSMEFTYIRLSDLMQGPAEFNWRPLEDFLHAVTSRGNQAVFRVWLEYPGQETGVPRYLIDQGVKITTWVDLKEHSSAQNRTPDYSDERLVSALETFIAELGRRYDHDPRIGFITAGLLGEWGEWHDAHSKNLFASRATQTRVMRAYEKAFSHTPILLRYPAGNRDRSYVPNAMSPFGYHDDSFAWATLPTGKRSDRWFFLARMNNAGNDAVDKWKTHPIGGEIRPEIWGQIFDEKPANPRAQDFAECVRQTHVTWLMDSGMVHEPAHSKRYERALAQVRGMGYDFYVQTADVARPAAGKLSVALQVVNQGVAPFYHDWALELGALSTEGKVLHTWSVDWKLLGLLPGDPPHKWHTTVDMGPLSSNARIIVVRVINPLSNGKPLRFANADQDRHARGWLSVGTLSQPLNVFI
ncbi:MAG TPA: hypothetical protein VMR25_23460 [Planctomycetaceae bacterium]|jgi:hypothetical protein|nr:hypothetical protein [Planctomycetaceae bacterium]